MRFVYKKSVNAQLLKGDTSPFSHRSAAFPVCFQRLTGFFHLLDAEILACIGFQFFDGGKRFIDLFLNNAFLPLIGKRNPLKLAVTDNDRIIIPGCNPGAELFAVGRFKILFPRYQQLCIGV